MATDKLVDFDHVTDYISREAAIDAVYGAFRVKDVDDFVDYRDIAVETIKVLPSAQSKQQWIPIKIRPMNKEEREYWECWGGYELKDENAVMFDCPMPEDGQEILVSYRKWISMDKCEIDSEGYGLEGNGDWDGVIAWMPLPEPYAEEGEDA